MKELIAALPLPEFGSGNTSFTLDSLGALALLKKAMADGVCVYKNSFNGYRSKPYSFYMEELTKLGLTQVYSIEQINYNYSLLINENTVIAFDTSDTTFSFSSYSLNKDLGRQIYKLAKENSEKPKKQGYVFAIMRQNNGLSLTRMGYAGSPLEELNYSKPVMDDYKYVVKDLKAPDPSGRIIILDGKPGTGKTYLVRSLLNEVPDAMFVIVPPSLVSSLGGPELLPLLVSNRQSYMKTGPTILVLEDADSCLAPRAADNMGSISSILNLGDGIFGSLLDIRIIATTNAKSEDMDEAIMRPGRLSKRIEVGNLSYEEANSIFQRLLNNKEELALPMGEGRTIGFDSVKKGKMYTLADVYKMAREAGWEPKPTAKAEDSSPALAVDEDD
jgi:hypothetical protein